MRCISTPQLLLRRNAEIEKGQDVLSRLEKVPVYGGGSFLLEEYTIAYNALRLKT